MMQAVTQNKKLKLNSPWRALEFSSLIPLDYELRCVIAFLLKWVKTENASRWNECNNEIQTSSITSKEYKAIKSKKEIKRKHK